MDKAQEYRSYALDRLNDAGWVKNRELKEMLCHLGYSWLHFAHAVARTDTLASRSTISCWCLIVMFRYPMKGLHDRSNKRNLSERSQWRSL